MDMRINWHHRPVHVEHEHAGCCLWTHAWDAAQVAPALLGTAVRQFVVEELGERFCAALLLLAYGQREQGVLDAWGFNVGEATRFDCRGNLVRRRVAHLFPGCLLYTSPSPRD